MFPVRPRRRRGRATTLVAVVLLALTLSPVHWMVTASLRPAEGPWRGGWFPADPSAAGYAAALHEQGGRLVTSLVVSLGTALLSLVLAAPAAHALALRPVRGAGAFLFGVLLLQAVPGVTVANALHGAYADTGLLDSHLGLVLADSTAGVPFAILVLRSAVRAIPREVVEAALLDGAGAVRLFRSVVLPLSRNALITSGVFAFLFAWGDTLFALTLTTSDAVRPVTLGVYDYLGAHSTRWDATMATAVLASLPAAVLLVVAQRHVTDGAARSVRSGRSATRGSASPPR
ncbi:carbohydrate ABC transporter permease [Streptomyces sp. WAC08241]|uniref:carbohydrate ABC transporter permease n=1 Tax=Streptomyces sp. WAC08241 TaxID=2487421 RepID=UPI0021AE51D0|nr:carbohydrate ABC transporter permease [Streptomyces sp. WAC08241]